MKNMRGLIIVFCIFFGIPLLYIASGLVGVELAKFAIESGLKDKYGESFTVVDIKQDMTLPIGGAYRAEVSPVNNKKKVFIVDYPSSTLNFSDDYQDDSASQTMTKYYKAKIDKAFADYDYDHNFKCSVSLSDLDKKIDTSSKDEIMSTLKKYGGISCSGYFLINFDGDDVAIEKNIGKNLTLFQGDAKNSIYSIGFVKRQPLDDYREILKNADNKLDTFGYSSRWSQYDNDIISGFYQIDGPIYSAEDFRKAWTRV